MSGESSADFGSFFVAAAAGRNAARHVRARLIRQQFGGSIWPAAPVIVESLVEPGKLWADLQASPMKSVARYWIAGAGSSRGSGQILNSRMQPQ
jgi:hypothetical protein